jgi:glycine betaine/proline transport system permease protein
MTDLALPRPPSWRRPGIGELGALAILLLGVAVSLYREPLAWAMSYPDAWLLPLKSWLSAAMKWLINDLDFGLFTFKDLTRAVAWVIEWPLVFAQGLLAKGFSLVGLAIPPVPWPALTLLATLAAWRLNGPRLALLACCTLLYLALFGRWQAAMMTVAAIVVAVPLGVLGGLLLGLVAHRRPGFERLLRPLLDFMQTVPVFAYLVPILFLFGFSPVSALISTVIFATPPMVRLTLLALRQVPPEIVEFGRMAGCNRRQMTWKVMVPAAAPGLMVGVNQVIMQSLNMVIIAAMIGAGGLGHEVLTAMRALKLGAAIEASVAIALIAIAVDRMSQAAARRDRGLLRVAGDGWARRHRGLLVAAAALLGGWLLGWLWAPLQDFPKAWQVTVGPLIDQGISAFTKAWFDELDGVKTFLLLNLMIPAKRFLTDDVPWVAVVLLLSFLGWRLGGWRLALLVGGLLLFIAVTGNWEPAMVSVYLCGIGVVVACLVGVPLGIAAAKVRWVDRLLQPVIDTLQTMPVFAYLIPAIMLFQNGDFTALLAIIAYAVVAPIRYTAHGLKQVPPALVEAAITSGCTPRQRLFKVELPLALPEILLGINQTIMMALSMLVITALVGTRDLGQEVYAALAKADVGRGLVAGTGVACLAIAADRLMQAWAQARKRRMGIAA